MKVIQLKLKFMSRYCQKEIKAETHLHIVMLTVVTVSVHINVSCRGVAATIAAFKQPAISLSNETLNKSASRCISHTVEYAEGT